MTCSRRTFLASASAAAAGLATQPLSAESKAKSEVFVGKGKAQDVIPRILKKMGGIEQFVKPKSRVVIKPNMSFANPPEWATTTSPEAVRTIAELCIKAGARRVIVCDHTLRDATICREKTGIETAVKDLKKVAMYTPRATQPAHFHEMANEKASQLTKTEVLKEVLRADALICVPIAKSHVAGGVSLGIKGLMGLVKDRGVFHREMDLQTAIAEQLYYIKPTLTIIDASRVLLNNGPAGPGKVQELNTFVGSIDPVATDSFGVSLASWYGRQVVGKNVKYLRVAAALGFGQVESDRIEEKGV